MWLSEVLTLAVGTLIVLVLIHLSVYWVTRTLNAPPPQPTVVYMQAPPAPPPPQQQTTFTMPTDIQHTDVPTVEPKNALPAPIRTREDRD